ncbi:DNA repair protein RecN [Salinibacterium xinjiangense]|uniref:DNA repair protein RecN n=1 Tax=Salinibacterium xinjiangense TaxID=386302 RepID=A0A2C8ZYG3_9MICO|nr:DNA repair protein RecN [Salinibacterium xinjiangense]GGL00220.1 DNA repair protein RecN [Salinibacterium xinjiangense]SOE71167.1 DNA replication and repair protein RecN [Salinibacterium xinjiangense]
MIEEITIHNLGVIGEARLPLGPGFTALTGETGAGKTMIVTALGLLLGDRADSGAIRSGSSQAVVEGRWQIDDSGSVAERVRDAGGDLDDGELILSRSISQEGRGRTVVGGRSAPVSVLHEIGHQLVVVHGQSDQVRLRSSMAQREALDRFAGASVSRVLGEYQDVFARWQSRQGELDLLMAEGDRRAREADDLRDAMAQIEAAGATRGEDRALGERADRLGNLEELRLAAGEARAMLSSEVSDESTDVVGLLTAARRQLERVADHDAALAAIATTVAEASIAVTEISGELSRYLATLDADGARELDVVNDRLAQLNSLVRKFGPSLDDTLDYLDSGSSRLLELDNDSTRIESLEREVETDRESVIELAQQLSSIRSEFGVALSERVTAELAALAMPNSRVTVVVDDRPDYSHTGKDQVSILLQAHSGAEPRPLGKGASGGELSRVMLAIEVVIAGNDPVPTFIFDEIDAGVGGASAIEVGRRLARLSRTAQVIVVTHLAQVAAFATNHLQVSKDSDGAVTASSVTQLLGEDRISEMARLLSGLPDSQSGLAHARELLDIAQELQQ